MEDVTQVCLRTSLTFHAQGSNDVASCCRGPVFVYLGKSSHFQSILHYRHMKMNPLCWGTLRWCRTLVIHLNTRSNLRKTRKQRLIFANISYKRLFLIRAVPKFYPGSEHEWNFGSARMALRSFCATKVHPRWDIVLGMRISYIGNESKFSVV